MHVSYVPLKSNKIKRSSKPFHVSCERESTRGTIALNSSG